MAPTVATPISESLDITSFVVTKGNGVKGLSEMGPKTLPREYIQPLEERISVNNIMTLASIPIIEMSNWDEPKLRRRDNFQKKTYLPTINVQFGTSFRPKAENSLEWKDYLSLFYVSEDEASALWPHAPWTPKATTIHN
ncbi:feruloyl coa ortho-hydroxylase 1 [Quercus suber]|uniref:Feruloyl coa ortho-hydroxylase 1 n=1 Tax=Quercus suber TaxID=58331 RepID=A0AAW0M7J7_QUESU